MKSIHIYFFKTWNTIKYQQRDKAYNESDQMKVHVKASENEEQSDITGI